jgi:hypothetical protein
MHTASRWLHQHLEERERAADAQPVMVGGGGDTEAKVRQQKSEDRDVTSNLLLNHPDTTLVTYV